jgi:hypothetical protein
MARNLKKRADIFSAGHDGHPWPGVMNQDLIIERPAYSSELPGTTNEEEGTLWLWAYPELLAWPCKIQWLFSPVVGNTKFPGDLYGVDETGRLILVEAKCAVGRADPYEDFIGKTSWFREMPTTILRNRWEKLLRHEHAFIEQYISMLQQVTRFERAHPGVVPYSSRRIAVLQWHELYRSRIAPMLAPGSDYETKVAEYLDRREGSVKNQVSYFALYTVPRGEVPKLSKSGRENYARLIAEAGPENVQVRAVQAIKTSQGIAIGAWTPSFQ